MAIQRASRNCGCIPDDERAVNLTPQPRAPFCLSTPIAQLEPPALMWSTPCERRKPEPDVDIPTTPQGELHKATSVTGAPQSAAEIVRGEPVDDMSSESPTEPTPGS